MSWFTKEGPWFFGVTRLCNACKNGELEQVKKLATPQNVNQLGWMGWAPLHKAVESGSVSVVQYLLETPDLKTNVNVRDLENHTALHILAGTQKIEAHHILIARTLLYHKAEVDAEDDGKYTALHLATLNNNIGIVEVLIEYGCNVQKKNEDGYTALHTACRYGYREIAKMLVEANADVNTTDAQGRTPLELSKRFNVPLNFARKNWAAPKIAGTQITNISNLSDSKDNDDVIQLQKEIEQELKEDV
eukprot:TRINITY_DN14673_c0_g1_i1.p1 TRINITY_DN14673_c0_g1~~TRINITY_DN14673_c0_g1_i1.p1  ORF type:complete len:247 (-),score=52.32 TRINITY_DN14673_c0_g1_i1:117-857(-)